MNNTQFRRLVLDTPTASKSKEDGIQPTPLRGGATPALGSRMRSSIPMTPRTVVGSSNNDFARQLAERNAELHPDKVKKFRSSSAPKGTKLGSAYQDRTQLRTSGDEDDKAVRVKALEMMVKLGQMDQTTFEALRDEIVGGEAKHVHLVKGLDYKLLARVRRGEDVLSDAGKPAQQEVNREENRAATGVDVEVDEELDKMESKIIQPVEKEERVKKGDMAPPPPIAGRKRARDDILKELKASRLIAAQEAKQPQLGPRFSKIGLKKETARVEKDDRGREVLITVDEDGKVKRKVKKVMARDHVPSRHGLLMPDKDAKPLGMEITPTAQTPAEEDDEDIFEGVGADYNPLGDVEGEDDDSNDSDQRVTPPAGDEQTQSLPPRTLPEPDSLAIPPSTLPQSDKRNYFGESFEEDEDRNTLPNPLTDPTILAALKKASTIAPISTEPIDDEESAKLARRKKMLESHDRDAEDIDMEFGSSRFGDQEDGDDRRVKLSAWDGDRGDDGEGKAKRKRGPKKRKGDVNSAADVLKVIERRKLEGNG